MRQDHHCWKPIYLDHIYILLQITIHIITDSSYLLYLLELLSIAGHQSSIPKYQGLSRRVPQ